VVGDEAVLLARRCACPMAVAPDRPAAAQALLDHYPVDVIIADDGLQHYALERDLEIVVVDGERRFGNGRCLPAGPLREPTARLLEADIVVANGGHAERGEHAVALRGERALNLAEPDRQAALSEFAGQTVHAVAGIGNPGRFFAHLRAHDIEPIEHPFTDHHPFRAAELDFCDGLPVLLTEKDAVKCTDFANPTLWYVPVDVVADNSLALRLLKLLKDADLYKRGLSAEPDPAEEP